MIPVIFSNNFLELPFFDYFDSSAGSNFYLLPCWQSLVTISRRSKNDYEEEETLKCGFKCQGFRPFRSDTIQGLPILSASSPLVRDALNPKKNCNGQKMLESRGTAALALCPKK